MRRNTLILALATLATTAPALGVAQSGRVTITRPGWLGIRCEVTVDVRDGRRTVTVGVGEVIGNSPAERSGLRPGDRIVRIDGKEIPAENCSVIGRKLEAGDTVRLRVQDHERGQARDLVIVAGPIPDSMMPVMRSRVRGPEFFTMQSDSIRRMTFTYLDSAGFRFDGDSMFFGRLPGFAFRGGRMHIDSLPGGFTFFNDSVPGGMRLQLIKTPFEAEFPFDRLEMIGMRGVAGAEFTELDPDLADYFGTEQGLLVTRVGPSTPAAHAGLKSGDVVTRVNGRAVHAVDDVRVAVARGGGQPNKVEIIRKSRPLTLELVTRSVIRRERD